MKKLAELTTAEFVDLLASDAPAPGGGSAAALEGALGAALSAMVCGLTTVGKSKEKYADYQEFVIESQKKLTELKVAFVDVMDRDTDQRGEGRPLSRHPEGPGGLHRHSL